MYNVHVHASHIHIQAMYDQFYVEMELLIIYSLWLL